MASDVGIANAALGKIGAGTLIALTDDSPEGRLANRTYAELRDQLLRSHPWNFATLRVSLAASSTAPVWEYDNAFLVPADFLRLIDVSNPQLQAYRVERTSAEGTIIVTDIGAPLKIKYIAQVTDANKFDASFREALAALLAREWAEPLTGITALGQNMAALYDKKLQEAKGVDGQEQTPAESTNFSWIDVR